MPDRYLVDTDVVSYLVRGDTRANLYRPYLRGAQLAVSFMTVAELLRWTVERNWGEQRRAALDAYLRRFVIHLVDYGLCQRWAAVSAEARRKGRPLETADAWIAATALERGLPLVTHNVSDYAGVSGLVIVAPAAP